MPIHNKYTDKELDFIRDNYDSKSLHEMADYLGRSHAGVKRMSLKIGLRRNKHVNWTQEMIDQLTAIYSDKPTKEVAETLDISIHSVNAKVTKLGLKKSKEYRSEIGKQRNRELKQSGKLHRFKKGHKPWNTGKKIGSNGRSADTQFKKGNRPYTMVEVGTISKTKDGYLKIKTENPNVWELYHRYIWKKAGKEIPEGHVIRFLDGNQENCELSNLSLITLEENMSKNTIHNYPEEHKKAMQTVGLLKRTINYVKKKQTRKS